MDNGNPVECARGGHADGALRNYRAVSAFVEERAVAYRLDNSAVLIDSAGRELQPQGLRFRWILPLRHGRAPACTTDSVHGQLDHEGRFIPDPQDAETAARLELTRVSHLAYERGYNVSIDGNVSYRLDDGMILMTPTGSHLGFIQPEDFVVTTSDGELVRGSVKPTSEYRLHVELHRRRPDCRCVVHVHAPYALAASLAGIDLRKTYITVAPVPTTDYARISSSESPTVLEPYMQDYNWAILPRHGIVAWAETPWQAFLRIEGLEHCAKVVVAARACGPIEPLPTTRTSELLSFWGLSELGRQG